MVWRPVVLEGVCETIWEVVAGACEMTLVVVGGGVCGSSLEEVEVF
jgi:hypothetical protein